jgi:hypothetical protein
MEHIPPVPMLPERRTLPELLSQAGQRLLDARDSGEVLEAKRWAEAALALARVTKAANETHADCLRVITRAEMRMAEEIDRGQETGEVARPTDTLRQNVVVRGADNDAEPATFSDLGIARQRVAEWRKIRDAGEEAVEQAIQGALADGRAPTKEDIRRAIESPNVRRSDSQLIQQSLSSEHYTPSQYLHAAREVLGGIDLDPASCVEANKVIGATTFFSADDNGLDKPWSGRVWLNPPYGRLAGDFAAKFVEEFGAQHITAGIMLVNAHCTDTEWFQPLWDGLLCFTDHRINFYGDDERSGSTHGSIFVYFGPHNARFTQVFAQFGTVVGAIAELAAPEVSEEVREEIERRITAGELATIEDVRTVKAQIAEIVAKAVEYARTVDRLREENRALKAHKKAAEEAEQKYSAH